MDPRWPLSRRPGRGCKGSRLDETFRRLHHLGIFGIKETRREPELEEFDVQLR